MFNPETGNFCVTLPMTSAEMPLHNKESVGLWICNQAHNWTQLKNKFSLVTAKSQIGLALIWGRYISPFFSWIRENFSFSSPKQGHEMPKALQKQKPQKQCRFHRECFQPALSSACQLQPSQRAESQCQLVGCPQHVNCRHGSFNTLLWISQSEFPFPFLRWSFQFTGQNPAPFNLLELHMHTANVLRNTAFICSFVFPDRTRDCFLYLHI